MSQSKNSTNLYKCKLCDCPAHKNANGLVRHIVSTHSAEWTVEQYYQKFIDEATYRLICPSKIRNSPLPIQSRLTPVCLQCASRKCKLKSFGKGFTVFCSLSCSQKNNDLNKARTKRHKEAIYDKYGVTNVSQMPGFGDKLRATKKARYGQENYVNLERLRETTKERYGVDYYTQTQQYKSQVKTTSQQKYGVNHFTQSEAVKKKALTTNRRKYGVDYYPQSKEGKVRIQQTTFERHGIASFLTLPEVREKGCKVLKERYGSLPLANEEFRKQALEGAATHSERFVYETGESFVEWLNKQNLPKPAYSSLKGIFPNKSTSIVLLQRYLKSFRNNTTHIEQLVEQTFATKHFMSSIKLDDRLYKPDFKLNESTYLNADGLFWHSERKKDKWYHWRLRKAFENNDLRLLQFRSDEIYHKIHIIKSIVNNTLNKTSERIFARKCIIGMVKQKQATVFLEQNHLMGSTKAKHIGLYFDDKLVVILSFKQKGHICKIERFCSAVGVVVVGGFSKLLKHLEQQHLKPEITEIHNWVDLRYGTGNHLTSKNFKMVRETLGWKWTNGRETFNRLKCRANMDERKLSMKEHAEELGWYKIYDAGQRLYAKYL